MPKYINAKDLELEVSHYLLCEKESETITLEELNEIANRLPSADVVDAVRCKDCKHREKNECNNIVLGSTKCGVYDEWFCADGERRKSE